MLPPKQSLDQDLDPCKSPAFLGDIVYPEANLTIVKLGVEEDFDVRDTMSEARVQLGRTGKMSVEATRSKQRRWHHSTSANLRSPDGRSRVQSKSERQARKGSSFKLANPRLHPDNERILQLVAGLQPPQDLKLDNSRQYVIVEAG